jgi:hypothetical protein
MLYGEGPIMGLAANCGKKAGKLWENERQKAAHKRAERRAKFIDILVMCYKSPHCFGLRGTCTPPFTNS